VTKPTIQFALVLHAHLPYVLAHGSWPHGSDMLFECAAESYVPLLRVLERLVEEGHSPRLTIGLTPVLTEQLAHPDFKAGFVTYLDSRIDIARENRAEFRRLGQTHLAELAEFWGQHFHDVRSAFTDRYGSDIVGAFRRLQDEGHIEVMTSAATHGYMPLLSQDTSLQAQVQQGVAAYRRHFGRDPRGFWLPECAYRPRYSWKSPLADAGPQEPYLRKGVEEFLSEAGLRYFIVDTATLMGGQATGVYLERFEALQSLWEQFSRYYQPGPEDAERSAYRPYLVSAGEGTRPVAVLARDQKTGIQVWSGEHGYPGDGWYLDFHKKHFPGGHRYWRVTSPQLGMGDKAEYEPARAAERVPENAGHFKQLVKDILAAHNQATGEVGLLCAPFDAELFGHWWFEGPEWIYRVLKLMSEDPEMSPVTCAEYLEAHPPHTMVTLPEGSWGQGGFHWIWLNDWTMWIWRHVYRAEAEMQQLVREFAAGADDKLMTILRQAARELLLLEASDWQFLISTWSARDYAENRAAVHFANFQRLREMASRYGRGETVPEGDWTFLGECEQQDAVFPDVQLRWFGELEYPPR